MTEFRRATAAVEAVEQLLAEANAETWRQLEGQLLELQGVEEKMRKRCEARKELEEIKEESNADGFLMISGRVVPKRRTLRHIMIIYIHKYVCDILALVSYLCGS